MEKKEKKWCNRIYAVTSMVVSYGVTLLGISNELIVNVYLGLLVMGAFIICKPESWD